MGVGDAAQLIGRQQRAHLEKDGDLLVLLLIRQLLPLLRKRFQLSGIDRPTAREPLVELTQRAFLCT